MIAKQNPERSPPHPPPEEGEEGGRRRWKKKGKRRKEGEEEGQGERRSSQQLSHLPDHHKGNVAHQLVPRPLDCQGLASVGAIVGREDVCTDHIPAALQLGLPKPSNSSHV